MPELIEATASAWLSLRDRGMNAAETAEFMRWLQRDPRHAVIFAELDQVWRDFDRLGSVPRSNATEPDCDLLVPRIRRHHHRPFIRTAIAAAAAVAGMVAIFVFRAPRPTAETAVGSFQILDLADGSVAQLNTDSAINTKFTATERRVQVVRGEVFFAVTKDVARPFIVTVGPVSVRAVGTAFNVRQREGSVEVLVTEGRVRIDDAGQGRSLLPRAASAAETPLLEAGESAVVAVRGRADDALPTLATVTKVSAPEVKRALAWQERRLEFDARTLADVVHEFNRYNRTQLVLTEDALATRRFSGTFRADGYESLVRLLEADFGVVVTRRDGAILLRTGR